MYVLSVQYSCAVVSVFLFCGKANLVLLTLFYFTLLALTDGRTDGRTDRQRVLVVCLVGCAVVSVFGSGDYDRKKKSSSRLSGGLCCCVSFWFWREIVSFFVVAGKFDYERKKKF